MGLISQPDCGIIGDGGEMEDPKARAEQIKSALEVYTDVEDEFRFVGWMLFHILGDLAKSRFDMIVEEYKEAKRSQ
jgi:hypothetical protein